jgi:AcrR family transcriptional regulator
MLVAAGTLIEEKGVDGLSLRECARRARRGCWSALKS